MKNITVYLASTLFPLLLFSSFSSRLMAQNGTIDSLLLLYEQVEVDSQKANLLQRIGNQHGDKEPKKALFYYEKSLDFISKETDIEKWIFASNICGVLEFEMGNYAKAITHFQKLLPLIGGHETEDTNLILLYNNIGASYKLLSNREAALDFYYKALELTEQRNDKDGEYMTITNLGFFYSDTEEWDKVIFNFEKALEHYKKNSPDNKFIAFLYVNISKGYIETGSFTKALNHLTKGLELAKKINSFRLESQVYDYLSLYYEKQGKFQLSLNYAKKFLDMISTFDRSTNVLKAQMKVSDQYIILKEYENALSYLQNALTLAIEIKNPTEVNKVKKKLFYLYKHKKSFKEATKIAEEVFFASDSLSINEYHKKLAEMEILHDVKNKEQALAIQELKLKEQEAVIAQKELRQKGLLIIGFLLLGGLIGIYFAYRQKVKLNQKLKELNELIKLQSRELKSTNNSLKDFSKMISHDILSQIELIISITNHKGWHPLNNIGENLLIKTKGTAKKLKQFAVGLISLAQIEHEHKPMQEVNLNSILGRVIGNLQREIDESGAVINFSPLPNIQAHEIQMKQLFQNIITNAIKYKNAATPPVLNIQVEAKETEYLFSFTDNGQGIPSEQQDMVFDSFYQVSNQSKGSGLGLAICKKIVEYYGGDIWVQSQLGRGTTVFCTYPLD